MFTIEEYIAKRKKEDNLNEFNKEKRMDSIKICIDYIFEYFNNYLEINEIDENTVLQWEKIEKYRKSIRGYKEDVQEWLINIYNKYENSMNLIIKNILKKNDIFLLYNTDAEFRSESYECYSKLVNKYKYLKDETEMLFEFIKDYHRITSNEGVKIPNFSDKFTEWINDTKQTYGVNVVAFVVSYLNKFSGEEDRWQSSHKILVKEFPYDYSYYDYDYKKKSNLFNIDQLYPKIVNKPFIKGKKQYLELLMMYHWLSSMATDKEYFQEYLNKVLKEI